MGTWRWTLLSVSDSLWPVDCTVQGILQARVLEWAAFPFSRGSSRPRDCTQVSHIAGGFFTSWATREGLDNHLRPWSSLLLTLQLHCCYLGFFHLKSFKLWDSWSVEILGHSQTVPLSKAVSLPPTCRLARPFLRSSLSFRILLKMARSSQYGWLFWNFPTISSVSITSIGMKCYGRADKLTRC